MNQATMCKHRELSPTLQLILLVSQPTNSTFINLVFRHNRQLFSAKKLQKPTACYLPNTKQETDMISDYLVNTVEHIAAGKQDVSFRS